MSTEEELFASPLGDDLDALELEGARQLGADSLTYLDMTGLDRAFEARRCAACFDGCYPQPVAAGDREAIARDRSSR